MSERDLAQEFIEILKQNNVKSVSINKLLAELEIVIIRFVKHDHVTKSTLAQALKINRTTLGEKMKRHRIAI